MNVHDTSTQCQNRVKFGKITLAAFHSAGDCANSHGMCAQHINCAAGKQRPGPFNGRLHPDGKNMKDEADGPTAQVEADDKCAPVMQQEMPRNLEGSLLQASIERMKSEQGTDAAHPSGDHITHTSEPGESYPVRDVL